jgi:hypothetical protein
MGAKIENRKFVNVVATVDLAKDVGHIRYVNPATSGVTSDDPGNPEVELSVEDAGGGQKKRWHPIVRFASSEPGQKPQVGLIQEDIPYEPWMNVLRLYVHGTEVANYQAGALPSHTAGMVAGGPGAQSLVVEPADPDRPHRRKMRLAQPATPHEGVTYTVQVKPEGSQAWHTLAVGRDKPDIEIDRNQFPGAHNADVRVIRTSGFDEQVVAQQKVDFKE